MQAPDKAKPAPASREPASNIEQLGGELNSGDSRTLPEIQASRLSRLFALTPAAASTIAALAYGVAG